MNPFCVPYMNVGRILEDYRGGAVVAECGVARGAEKVVLSRWCWRGAMKQSVAAN